MVRLDWVLVPDEHLVALQTHLMPTEGYVEALMRWMNFTGRKATMMMTTSNVERLTIAGAAADDGIGWHIAVGVTHPAVSVANKQLELVFDMFATSMGHIGAALAGNDLEREMGREREYERGYCRILPGFLTLAGSRSPSW